MYCLYHSFINPSNIYWPCRIYKPDTEAETRDSHKKERGTVLPSEAQLAGETKWRQTTPISRDNCYVEVIPVPGTTGGQAENNLGLPKRIKGDFIWHVADIAFCYWFFFFFPYSPNRSKLQPKNVSSSSLYPDLHRTFHRGAGQSMFFIGDGLKMWESLITADGGCFHSFENL